MRKTNELPNKKGRGKPSRRKAKRYKLNKRGKKVLIRVLFFVCIAVLIYSVVRIIGMALTYKQGRDLYDAIAENALIIADEREIVNQGVFTDHIPNEDNEEKNDPVPEKTENKTAAISGALPWEKQERIIAETGVTVKWDTLLKQNKDTVAWLYLPDSDISYPVVQTTDNDFYLDHDFLHGADESGTLFFDYRNFLEETEENWIIYGHRRNDRSMFGNLVKYSKESFLSEHPVMYLIFPDRAYRAEVFACRTVHALPQYFQPFFYSSLEFRTYIDRAIEQSYWKPSVVPDTDHPILTLATCSTYVGDDNPRLLVHASLVPIG